MHTRTISDAIMTKKFAIKFTLKSGKQTSDWKLLPGNNLELQTHKSFIFFFFLLLGIKTYLKKPNTYTQSQIRESKSNLKTLIWPDVLSKLMVGSMQPWHCKKTHHNTKRLSLHNPSRSIKACQHVSAKTHHPEAQ